MTLQRTRRPAGHGGGPDEDGVVTESAARRAGSSFGTWLRRAPAERASLLAVPAVWTAAEILHAAGVPALLPGAAAAAAAGISYGVGERNARGSDDARPRFRGAELAAAAGAAGAWVTAATALGPLAGPYDLLSVAYGLGAAGGCWWLRTHDAVRAARERRRQEEADAAEWEAKKAAWHVLAPQLGLQGSHLLAYDKTLLGDSMLIDTRGTGRRASHLAGGDLAERIGEIEMIPVGRIDVARDKIPGRLRITIRRAASPWKDPVWHTAARPDSPWAKYLPCPATIRQPLAFGVDPETGAPLEVEFWNDNGGLVVWVIAATGSGKTMLLDTLTERITACPDARLLQVNLSKALEDTWWAPLSAASATGAADVARAQRILQFAYDVIEGRPRSGRPSRVHQPTPGEPLFILKIDEADKVAGDPARAALLARIASTLRSEGVALLLATQRPLAASIGGNDVRMHVRRVIYGKFTRSSELRHAGGTETIALPDMGDYGENNPGVFGVTELPPPREPMARGRGFFWGNDGEPVQRIVRERLARQQPFRLEPALAHLAADWAAITGTPAAPGAAAPFPAGTGAGVAGPQDQARPPRPDPRFDVTVTRGGQTVPGVAGIRAAIDEARAVGTTPAGIPELTAEAERALDEYTRRQHRDWEARYAGHSASLPTPGDQDALRELLARPGGITIRDAARALSGHPGCGRDKIHRQLRRWQAEGLVELRGSGASQHWHAVPPGAPGGTRPAGGHLRVVPGGQAASQELGPAPADGFPDEPALTGGLDDVSAGASLPPAIPDDTAGGQP